MKKILSFTLAVCIAVTSLFSVTFAFADTAKPKTADIKAKISGAADYLVTEESEFTTANAVDFLTFLNSGKDMSAYKDAFIKSVKDNLDENGGKLASSKTDWSQDADGNWVSVTTTVESPALYGSVILVLDKLGYDFKSFEGYNIADAFSKVSLEDNGDNPYYYSYTLAGAEKANLSGKFISTVCNSFIDAYYVVGQGMNYWGYSCDNTCQFVVAMAPYSNIYKAEFNDALSLIATYKTDGGYFSNSEYGTEPNADSTALALAAYSAAGDLENAEKAYADLCKFESSKTGVFTYYGEENEYATKDALFGLEKFLNALPACYDGHSYKMDTVPASCTANGYITYTCTVCGDKYTETLQSAGHSFGNNLEFCSVCGAKNVNYIPPTTQQTTTKKPTAPSGAKKVDGVFVNSKYKKPTISKLTKGKKQFKVSWKKVSGVSGYQIQYSTSSKFYKSKTKSVTIKGNKSKTPSKTVKSLKSKKTYYVRVRTYKNVKFNGKTVKVYSGWSKVKSVKTK